MKYKVGDKVEARSDLVVNEVYGKDAFVSYMSEYLGKVVTISSFHFDLKDNITGYHIEDKGGWCFTDEMLEPLD